MKADQDQKKNVLLYIQMLFMIVIFWVVHLVLTKRVERFWIWVALIAFVVFAYYRFSYNQKHYVAVPMQRTKPLKITMRLMPILAVIGFILLPSNNGLNSITAGIIFALDTYFKDKTKKYFTPDEYEKFVRKMKRKKKK